MMLRRALELLKGPKTGLHKLGLDQKVHVAMSSGVDSATTAALMAKLLGPKRVEGVFMNNWQSGAKCSEADWASVQKICDHIGIQCRRIDLERDYWTDVFEPMVSAYREGSTPNPDVSCNRYIKFGSLIDSIEARDPTFQFLATGHYAGLSRGGIARPDYRPKDQSYYLSTVNRDRVERALFPLAHFTKPDVRKLAHELLPQDTAEKPDSQGLCFVEQTSKKFSTFLADYLTPRTGAIETTEGVVVGEHNGLWTHTIGQRVSLSLPQHDPATRGQWFVVAKDTKRNVFIVAPGRDNELLWTDTIRCDRFSWHTPPPASSNYSTLEAQYRSLQEPAKVIDLQNCGANGQGIEITFSQPRRAITPGQYLVIYDNDEVIGAGIISSTSSRHNPSHPSANAQICT